MNEQMQNNNHNGQDLPENELQQNPSAGQPAQPDGEYHFSRSELEQTASEENSRSEDAAQDTPAQQRSAYEPGYCTYDDYESPFHKGTPMNSHRFDKPKKQKRQRKGAGLGMTLLCCLLSLLCGFGGAWAYDVLLGGGNTVLFESAPPIITPTDGDTASLADVVELCKPSVVEITTEVVSTGSFFSQSISEGAGSGVILTADGYIVTNYHVIEGARNVSVTTAAGSKYPATVYGYDVENDLAVLKITANDLPFATFGDSSALRVGDSVIAIGNPLGSLGGTVTEGIVSALDREIMVEGQQMVLLQTSAAVNPGNSGGGLFNIYGQLVGVVNAKSSGEDVEGLGFAINSNTVKEITTAIIEQGGAVSSGSGPVFGISVINILDTQTAQQYRVSRLGVYIADITPGYGAEAAGLQTGDYIVSIEDVAISTIDDISAILAEHVAGDYLDVQIIRDNRLMTFSVELMESAG